VRAAEIAGAAILIAHYRLLFRKLAIDGIYKVDADLLLYLLGQ